MRSAWLRPLLALGSGVAHGAATRLILELFVRTSGIEAPA